MSLLHFYPANLLSTCLPLLLHLRLSGLPREPRERLISPCTDKSDGDRAALTHTEAFDQKATHTFPRKAVCLKPARRVYAVYRLPSGENSRWSGGCRVCLERTEWTVWSPLWWQFPDMRHKKSCLTRPELTFYTSLQQGSAFSILSRGCSLIVLRQT